MITDMKELQTAMRSFVDKGWLGAMGNDGTTYLTMGNDGITYLTMVADFYEW